MDTMDKGMTSISILINGNPIDESRPTRRLW